VLKNVFVKHGIPISTQISELRAIYIYKMFISELTLTSDDMAQGMKYLDGFESYISVTEDPVNDCTAFAQLAGNRRKIWFSGFSREQLSPRIQKLSDVNVIYFSESTEFTTEALWQYIKENIINCEQVCIMFDDISPLLITHTFEKFSMNLKAIADLISEHDSVMLVCIDKHKVHRRQIAFLKTFLQQIKLHRTAFFPPGSKCVCPICGAIIDCFASKCSDCGVEIVEDVDTILQKQSDDQLRIARSQLKLYGQEDDE